VGTAVSAETARWVGGWADGLATIHQPLDRLERVVAAFREGGGEGKPMVLQVHVAWAADDDEALRIAHDQWRNNIFDPPVPWDLETVEHFDQIGSHVRPQDMHGGVRISSDPAQHVQWLQEAAELGFDEINVHHVGQDQAAFIDAFGEHVLPELA
jgi:alkanesulfonate monooxygenase SsuD/methylene tetrahydromethanopterin reductase-like flavin-dependent oxidoreductase (luciferase family)